MTFRLVPALCLLLASCHLIDERTFDPQANRLPRTQVAAASGPSGPPPLIAIRFDTPDIDYRDAVRRAVVAARARKPDVIFQVVTMVPAAGTPDEQVAAAQAAMPLGRDVEETIVGAGADIGQVELASRAEPAVMATEVRVYLR